MGGIGREAKVLQNKKQVLSVVKLGHLCYIMGS